MIRQLLDVVHHALQMPLRVDLLASAQVQPCEPLVVPDVAKHWLHRADALAIEASALGRINGTSHALARMVRIAGFRLEAGDLPPTRILRTLQALVAQAPDWDIPISFIMALMAYLTASWSMHVMVERQWRQWPLMLFWTWFTVDGCYWLYWHFKNPVALELMREANAPASLSLYWMCGLVWYYRGTLREMWADLKRLTIKPV